MQGIIAIIIGVVICIIVIQRLTYCDLKKKYKRLCKSNNETVKDGRFKSHLIHMLLTNINSWIDIIKRGSTNSALTDSMTGKVGDVMAEMMGMSGEEEFISSMNRIREHEGRIDKTISAERLLSVGFIQTYDLAIYKKWCWKTFLGC